MGWNNIANVTIHSRALTADEHRQQMIGKIPPGNLVLLAPLWGASPEPNFAGSMLNGTVINTTIAVPPPVMLVR